MKQTGHARLECMQALRALAAGAVVLAHLQFHAELRGMPSAPPAWLHYGYLGVDLFFVLSGWIIVHVHGDDIGQPGRAGRYAWRRFSRVWPLLALLTTAKLLLIAFSGGAVAEDGRTSASSIVTSYLCLPHPEPWPVLSVAWTLRHEALFYLLFGLAILLGRCALGAIAALWIACIAAAGMVDKGPWLFEFLGSPLNLHFMFGCAAAWWTKRHPSTRMPGVVHVASLVLLAAAACLLHGSMSETPWSTWTRLPLGLLSALLLVALVRREQLGALRVPRTLSLFGDASYSLYLWHGFLVGGLCWLWTKLPEPLASHDLVWQGMVLCAAFGSSLLLYLLVEKPLVSLFQSFGRGRSPERGPA